MKLKFDELEVALTSVSADVRELARTQGVHATLLRGTPDYRSYPAAGARSPQPTRRGCGTARRAFIYALGAILYAILTLKPSVEKAGEAIALLIHVVEGDIQRPKVRAPQRHVPPELSAIAMKALAKAPKDRYQTVEALRRDLELFLEGRSVSAKQDTVCEQVWKLMTRNQGARLAAAALVVLTVVLAGAFQINWSARLAAEEQRDKAETAYRDYKREQTVREAAVRKSLPALVRAGQQLVNENRIDQAEEPVQLALAYDADNPEAHLLKGQILVAMPRAASSLSCHCPPSWPLS